MLARNLSTGAAQAAAAGAGQAPIAPPDGSSGGTEVQGTPLSGGGATGGAGCAGIGGPNVAMLRVPSGRTYSAGLGSAYSEAGGPSGTPPGQGFTPPVSAGGAGPGPGSLLSPAHTPGSRPSSGRAKAVQLLVDAVRSKDEGRLADTLDFLRLPNGTVAGACCMFVRTGGCFAGVGDDRTCPHLHHLCNAAHTQAREQRAVLGEKGGGTGLAVSAHIVPVDQCPTPHTLP